MTELRKMPEDVFAFLEKAASLVGRIHDEQFSQFTFSVAVGQLESPIEDLFFIACAALCESCYQDLNVGECSPGERGVFIKPQKQIGPYRVDFVIEQVGLAPEDDHGPVVVELDGHGFHDKDKRQRSYEKARDRYLVRNRYRVLHFTGSDVVADPFRIAYEALDLLGVFGGVREGYDPNNPLGIE